MESVYDKVFTNLRRNEKNNRECFIPNFKRLSFILN